ncbi:MAG: hypothetical protein GY862_04800 [Gammaproteobacteria bacterium]|nr:hypothetical protein [Gammaproteobacteria bacterium]
MKDWRNATGEAGFKVIVFAFERMHGQEPPPWESQQVGTACAADLYHAWKMI